MRVTWRPSPGVAFSHAASASTATDGPVRRRTEAQHVGVIVFAREVRRRHVVHDRGANAGNLVGGHGDPDARATDRDAEVALARGDASTHGGAEVGIVDRIGAVVGAEVERVVAPVGERLGQQRSSGQIQRDLSRGRYASTQPYLRNRRSARSRQYFRGDRCASNSRARRRRPNHRTTRYGRDLRQPQASARPDGRGPRARRTRLRRLGDAREHRRDRRGLLLHVAHE